MGIKQNKNYPEGSHASRGVFIGERSFKAFGFTKDEERRWREYGVGPVDAMKYLSKGLTLDAIDKMLGYQQELFKKASWDGCPKAAYYINEMVRELEDEENNYYTRDEDEVAEFNRTGNTDLQHAARKSLRKELLGVNDEASADEDEERIIDVSARPVSISESRRSLSERSSSRRVRSSKKPLMMKSNNG